MSKPVNGTMSPENMVPSTPTANFHIGLINVEKHPYAWSHAETFVAEALKHSQGEMSLADAAAGVCSGKIQLWLVVEEGAQEIIGAATTEIIQYPQTRALRVITIGGKRFQEWASLMNRRFEQMASLENCTRIEAVGRQGLSRMLIPYGFSKAYVFLTKEVPGNVQNRRDDDQQIN